MRRAIDRAFASFLAGFLLCSVVPAGAKPRVASINVCTDQLLLALADPDQIVGLSPASRNPTFSYAAAAATQYHRLSGQAEDVLVLDPDFVVASQFTRRATRELLKAKSFRVIEFDVATSIDDVREQIRRMGELVEHPDRATAILDRLDAAVERVRAAHVGRPLSVLPLSRRGWVSGASSLMNSLLETAGLTNPAARLGRATSGYASLELIVSAHPDLILIADDSPVAEDQGSAFLLHPALLELYPPEKRLVVPGRLTVCGGPMVVHALERLTAEIKRVSR